MTINVEYFWSKGYFMKCSWSCRLLWKSLSVFWLDKLTLSRDALSYTIIMIGQQINECLGSEYRLVRDLAIVWWFKTSGRNKNTFITSPLSTISQGAYNAKAPTIWLIVMFLWDLFVGHLRDENCFHRQPYCLWDCVHEMHERGLWLCASLICEVLHCSLTTTETGGCHTQQRGFKNEGNVLTKRLLQSDPSLWF